MHRQPTSISRSGMFEESCTCRSSAVDLQCSTRRGCQELIVPDTHVYRACSSKAAKQLRITESEGVVGKSVSTCVGFGWALTLNLLAEGHASRADAGGANRATPKLGRARGQLRLIVRKGSGPRRQESTTYKPGGQRTLHRNVTSDVTHLGSSAATRRTNRHQLDTGAPPKALRRLNLQMVRE